MKSGSYWCECHCILFYDISSLLIKKMHEITDRVHVKPMFLSTRSAVFFNNCRCKIPKSLNLMEGRAAEGCGNTG